MHVRSDTPDLQLSAPAVGLALDAAGVLGIRRAVTGPGGVRTMAGIDAAVDLGGDLRGVHMSRFHESIAEAVEASGSDAPGADLLAARIAAAVAERQDAARATVAVTYDVEIPEHTPATGLATVLTATVRGEATVDCEAATSHRTLGVTVAGMNACPCAQELVRAHARERLLAAGFDAADADRALDAIPAATHNQRGTATLVVGTEAIVDPFLLVRIARDAMSAHVHELLKREDELAVVEAAHANPRFVEDCVREAIAGVLGAADLPLADHDTVWARQVNHESIHAHDVVAERGGTVGALRAELAERG